MDASEVVAALDCGTNSTRLLVADGRGVALDRRMTITRLGEGVDATGRLADAAVERTLEVLRAYRRVMDRLGVARARLAATSAARDAANGGDFLAAAGEIVGARAELLTGPEEGRLSLAGATGDLDPGDGPFLVVDIGGGSTELVAGTGPDDPDLDVVSLQIGCVRVTERFLVTDPPSTAERTAAEAAVRELLEDARDHHPMFGRARRLVGLAGTVSTLASLDQGLADYDRDRIHHAVLTAGAVDRWAQTLLAEPAARRLGRPGMVPGREDVIAGGALVLRAVLTCFGFERCLVSEADILDGLVLSQLAA
jgi:exopolyphosphatase/guanosine-5'-triphosphate,3'-diphosphate pyrophosphatase